MIRLPTLLMLAMLASCGTRAPLAQAQATAPASRDSSAIRRPEQPHAAVATHSIGRERNPARRSVTEKLFDAQWVIFPARLSLVIVFSALAALLLTSGTWVTVRLAHSMRHLRWKEPPRRWKRGELGAIGTTLGWEFEERTSRELARDEERDQQIVALQKSVERLS